MRSFQGNSHVGMEDLLKSLTLAFVLLLVVPCVAPAQSYLQSALEAQRFRTQLEVSQQPRDPARKPQQAPNARQAAIAAERHRLMLKHARKVAPEYHRRIIADGKKSADAWLAKVAEKYERQDRKVIRAEFGDK